MSQEANRERQVFGDAIELPAERRGAFIKEACGTDDELLKRVQELLDAYSDESPVLRNVCDASPESQKISEGPGTKIGRYELLEKIGEGGFGEVWMAEQRDPVIRRVALKILKLGMDSRQVVARFEAERQTIAMMDHPNIAKIFDAGTTDTGRPYFVMELVRGLRITEYCDQNQLPTRERLNLFILVCQAIQHAHQKGIIHSDIKPSNILVTPHDSPTSAGCPKVIDFGIAKVTQQELTDKTVFTQLQQFIGTPAYISPEQAEMSGLDVDTRADIYSLGVLLYELLVGHTPFDAKQMIQGGLDALRRIIREEEPPRPSTRLNTLSGETRTSTGIQRQTEVGRLVHQIQGDLDWIVMKCLEKDRTRRYETANALAADVQRHLANEPIIARPPSAAYKLQKAWRRNKILFTSAAVVAVALLAGIGISTWQARKASDSERRSRRILYAAHINLAQQSLKLNNLGKARQLLERHRPQPGEEDLRGWEWRYLWQLTRGNEPVTLTNRPMMQGCSVRLSSDGRSLAVGWRDGRVDLWDVPSRRWVRALTDRERPHPGRVAFSPAGNLLAATSERRMVTLYDLDSGRESILWRAPDQSEWDVRDLAFSQDGSRLVVYAGSNPEGGDAVWVVNVSSSQSGSPYPAGCSHHAYEHFGAARLSPDNRRLYLSRSDYLNHRYSIQCIDLGTGKELWQTLWQTGPQTGMGLTTLEVSPDGRVLASGAGFIDTTIHIWDAETGKPLKPLPLTGHTGCIYDLAFSRDGRHLVSAALDQTIRFWDTSAWTETQVLRGHTDEVWSIAISEPTQLVASVSKDGNLNLWRMDDHRAFDGYRRLPKSLGVDDIQPLDHSRVLLLPPGHPPEVVDLDRDSPPMPLPQIGSSTNVLGCFGTNILCYWNGTHQILVSELHGVEFMQRGAISLESAQRPTGFTYNPARQLVAWSEGTSSRSLYLASLTSPNRRIELTHDVPGLVPVLFSHDGNYLAATKGRDALRAWNVESGEMVVSINQNIGDACFAANGTVLVVAFRNRVRNEIGLYDLAHPGRVPQRIPGGFFSTTLAVSPDGGLVSATPLDGRVLLLDPATGRLVDTLRGQLISADRSAFSPDGRRLSSPSNSGQEAVQLWDVGTRQELLTLVSRDSTLYVARWSADGNVILAGPPWQAWRAPSWKEIEAAEAKERAENRHPKR